jgi:hypothetical protein
MSANIVEALSRHAAHTVTRRGSFLSLGGMLAAAVAVPSLALAGKKNGKNKGEKRKKAKKKADQQAAELARLAEQAEAEANQICANQIAGCRQAVLSNCSAPGGQCIAAADCCSSLAACNTTEFFSCIVASTGSN